MLHKFLKYHFLFFLILLLSNHLSAQTDSSGVYKVYTFNMKEMIAPPIWRITKLAMENAEKMNADLILIHMNTYGGTLDDADSIRTKILNSKIPVYVFIDKNAASAGALISIACDSIYMAPGASIGAATVVNQSGEALPDKYQSYMRSMMRATAEAKGRDALIAQAMVDPRLYVPGVSDSGQVLTFTTSEAIKYHFCEGQANSLEEVLEHAGIENYTFINHKISTLDKIIGWLINPFISGILIMIIIGGIYFELQSPGIGFPLAAAAFAALLYFAPLYLEGLANHWEILLFVVGIVLVLIEIFAIPGFGITGVSGIILIITGLTLSMVGNIGPGTFDYDFSALTRSFLIVLTSFFLALISSFFLTKKLFTSNSFGHLALTKTQQVSDGYTSASTDYSSMLQKKGVAITILRPSGKIDIEGNLYDATAISGYIEKDEKVVVVNYQTSQLIVKKYSKPKA